MPAYMIVNANISDPTGYAEYQKRTPDVIKKFGGRFLVRGGKHEILEGQPGVVRSVLIEFPSFDQARAFWSSPDYQEVKKLRQGKAKLDVYLVDGAA
jgi:uncharacterized protein (DUF1330 family)